MNLATSFIIQPRDTKLNKKIAVYFMQKHSISNIKVNNKDIDMNFFRLILTD